MRTLLLSLLLLAPLAHAQDKPPPPDVPPPAPSDDPDEVARQAIEQALDALVTVNFDDAPLADALDTLRELTPLQLVLDPAVPDDFTVSFGIHDLTVRDVLDQLLQGRGLQVRVFSGALVILPTGKDLGAPPRVGPGAAGQALMQRSVTLNFPGTPLTEVVSFLRDITGLTIEVAPDAQRLVETGEANLRVRDMNLRQALTLITHLSGLTWRTDGDALRLEARRPRQRAAAPAPASAERPDGPRLVTMTKEQVEQRLQTPVTLSADEENLHSVVISGIL